jgi:hypothetical protein
MMRRVGTDYDTVESLFRWYRTWQSPEAQQKFRLLHGASIKQNFNIWIFGYYDGNLNVKQLSPDAGELSLSKNYPNPVVNTATINFAVTQPGKVTIILYNSLGQAVKTLANYHYQPGTYTSELDASELPVGTYIYTMTTGSFSTSKTLNIIR